MRSFHQLIACLLVAVVSMSISSCDTVKKVLADQQTQQLLGAIITNMMGQQGSNYQFKGSGTTQLLTLKAGGTAFQDYEQGSKQVKFNGQMMVVVNNTNANMIIPDLKVGEGTMNGIKLYNMQLSQATNATGITVGDNSTIDGTYTINGKAYKASNLYISATVTNQQLNITLMSIYFGDNGEYAVNIVFDGQTAPLK